MGRWRVGASALQAEVHDAEHLLADLVTALRGLGLVDDSLVACTQLVTEPWPHEAVSVELVGTAPDTVLRGLVRVLGDDTVGLAVTRVGCAVESTGPADAVAGAVAAAAAHATRTAGRAVVFPGRDILVGELPVADVVARSAIELVTSLSGEPASGAVLETRDFVRPEFVDGRLTLRCLHDDPARLVPWEPAVVHRCGGH